MADNNSLVIGNLSAASKEIYDGAQQVSTSSQMLAQGSAEQASVISEISAALESIVSKTKENADDAETAKEHINKMRLETEHGDALMQEMLEAIDEINEASKSISGVISLIENIAFQTNILALNAAVEAARAGQSGKGFAVVAEEVRSLASKSSSAAKDSSQMINRSINKVEIGTKIARDTAQSLSRINNGIFEATNMVDKITVASEEKSAALDQINIGVNQVVQVIQSITASSEESAAASEELTGQVRMLEELVGRFKCR